MKLTRKQLKLNNARRTPQKKSKSTRCPTSLWVCAVLFPITLWAILRHGAGDDALINLDMTTAINQLGSSGKIIVKTEDAKFLRPNCGKKGSRTLVMLMGDLECGEVAWESLYRHVLDVNCADLAILIPKEQASQTPAPSLLKRAKYIWKYDDYKDWGFAWDTVDKDWRQKIEMTPKAVENGVFGGINGNPGSGAKYLMLRHLLREHLLKDGVIPKYDRFILSTTGQYYVCDFDVSSLSPHWVWLPEGGGQVFVGGANHVAEGLDVLTTMLEQFTVARGALIWTKTYTMERLLVAAYDIKKLPTDGFRRLFYACQLAMYGSSAAPPASENQRSQFSLAQESCPKSGLAPDSLLFQYDESSEEEGTDGDEDEDKEEEDSEEDDSEEDDDEEDDDEEDDDEEDDDESSEESEP